MNVNELRCGNLVYVDGNCVTVVSEDIYGNVENMTPIKLNVEWILELGFEKVEDDWIFEDYYELKSHKIKLLKIGGDHSLWQVKFGKKFLPLGYGHVHEIQNLVYWLVREEI